MAVRAVRGATQVSRDDRDLVLAAAGELLTEILRCNQLGSDQLISILFTATDDLRSAYPAVAARDLGITDVPLMCARELDVEDGMPRVVRVLLHADIDGPRSAVRHVYLHGAAELRTDLTQ